MSKSEEQVHRDMTYPYGQTEARFRSGDGIPVVALDIDGTLGDYHRHFLWFAEQWFGRSFPPPHEVNPGMRLSTFMGIPHHEYRECKLAYRQGGLKRFMPAYPFVADLTHNIRLAGTQVWLCTTRPYLRLDNIDPDTREWLRRNNISYDAIIFDSRINDSDGPVLMNKYQDLVRQVGQDRVVAAVDDLPEQIHLAIEAGIRRVYLRNQPYNGDCHIHSGRVQGLEDLWDFLEIDIANWKGRHG